MSHIANSTAKLPRHLLDEKDKQVNHDYLDLITYSLIEGIVSYLKLTGTAYIWKNTIGGRVRELHILSTNSVNPVWDSNRTKIVSYDYFVNGKNVKFKADEIIRIINFSPLQQYPYITE